MIISLRSTAVFLHCRCLPPLPLLSPSASASLHRRCLPPPPLPPHIAAALPHPRCVPRFLRPSPFPTASPLRCCPSSQVLALPTRAPPPATAAPLPHWHCPPPLVGADTAATVVTKWCGKDTRVKNGREAAAPISGGGRPPLEGTTSNDSNARPGWRWLALVRGGEWRRSCMAVMHGAASSMAQYPAQRNQRLRIDQNDIGPVSTVAKSQVIVSLQQIQFRIYGLSHRPFYSPKRQPYPAANRR